MEPKARKGNAKMEHKVKICHFNKGNLSMIHKVYKENAVSTFLRKVYTSPTMDGNPNPVSNRTIPSDDHEVSSSGNTKTRGTKTPVKSLNFFDFSRSNVPSSAMMQRMCDCRNIKQNRVTCRPSCCYRSATFRFVVDEFFWPSPRGRPLPLSLGGPRASPVSSSWIFGVLVSSSLSSASS
jgi:hypothetical protein